MAVELRDWPDIYITLEAKNKLDLYVEFASGEISGLGDVEVLSDGTLLISDVYIFEQKSSGGSTEIEADTIADFIRECISEERDLSKIRLWWHSHGNMNAFWSTTDDDTSTTCFRTAPFFISLVANKAGESRVRLDMFMEGGSHFPITIDNIPLKISMPITTGLREQIEAEVSEKVSSPSKTTSWTSYTWDENMVFCKEPRCTARISKTKPSGVCYDHEPLKDTEARCKVPGCDKKFYTAYDAANSGKCTSCRNNVEPSKKVENVAIGGGNEIGANSAIDDWIATTVIERTIEEYGPTAAEATHVEWDGEYVYERNDNEDLIAKYKLEENPELYAVVMAELDEELPEDSQSKSLAEFGGFSEGYWDDDEWVREVGL